LQPFHWVRRIHGASAEEVAQMFGIGNNDRRQVRNDTFGGNKMRNAAIAGVGMLAWKWWKNRQQSGQQMSGQQMGGKNRSFSDRSYSGSSTGGTDAM
jgi:hypothetical protein